MISILVYILLGLLIAENVRAATTWTSYPQAWIYPGSPACNARNEFKDGRKIHTLKPEYYTVTSSGDLQFLTESSSGCNGYSASNAAEIKQYSTEQFVTVSGGGKPLVTSATKRSAAVTTLVNFAVSSGFTGVELDFEGYGKWDATEYSGYVSFVTALGNGLRARGKKLMIDGPPIFSSQSQAWYKWKYEDFENLPIDYLLVMAYDYQYDYTCGQAIAPNDWVRNIVSWTKSKVSNIDRIVIGIPSYGYSGTVDQWDVNVKTKALITSMSRFSAAVRQSSSYEMSFTNGQTVTFYQDTAGMNSKRALIESLGIKRVSVWHLGGNDWFTGTEPSFTSSSGSGSTSTSGVKAGTSSTTRAATSSSSGCVCQNQREVDENGNIIEGSEVQMQAAATDSQTQTNSQLSNRDVLILSIVGAVVGISGMIVGTVVGYKVSQNRTKPNQNRFNSQQDSDDERNMSDDEPSPKKGVNKRRQIELTTSHMDTPEMNLHAARRGSSTPDPLRKATLTRQAATMSSVPINEATDK